MNERRDLDARLERWFESEATGRAPDRMFEQVFSVTARTRQARAWPSWLSLPATGSGRRLVILMAAALIALALASGALIAGADRLFQPPRPAPRPVSSVTAATFAGACPHPDAVTPVGPAVWVHCPDQVRRLDPVTGGVTGVLQALAFAADDRDAWVATDLAVNVLDASSLATVTSLPLAGVTAIGLEPGSAWIVEGQARLLLRVDRASLATTATIPLPDEPFAVAVGGGSVWVTIPAANRVLRIDSATNAISASVEVVAATAIEFAARRVWVLDSNASALTMIEPATNATQTRAFVPIPAKPGTAAALPPGSPGPPGGFALVGTSLWEVAGADAVEINVSSGDVLQTIHLADPADVGLTAIAGLDGQLLVVDARGARVLRVPP